MLQILLFWSGLAYFSFQDATTHSVPAQPFELWSLQLYLLSIPTHELWWTPLIWWASFSLLARFNYLGSADAWLIGVLASQFGFMSLLWVLLIACFTGLIHATVLKQHQLPWIPHLAMGSLLVTLIQLV